jgi:hypothetical protein
MSFKPEGQWTSTYYYHDDRELGHHIITFKEQHGLFIANSDPGLSNTDLTLELMRGEAISITGEARETLTGTWQEITDVDGEYEGMLFYGGVQFILAASGLQANGGWVGYNRHILKVNHGRWVLRSGELTGRHERRARMGGKAIPRSSHRP